LVIPLRRPYILSFGVLRHLDSFIALARFADGAVGLGESCPLPGYSHETPALLTSEYERLARDGDLDAFYQRNRANPFVTAPVLTALEEPARVRATGRVDLCPLLQCESIELIPQRVAELRSTGNCLAKVKLSADLGACRSALEQLQAEGIRHGMRFRYDANQAMTPAQAETVLGWLDHPTTELLEQPLAVDAWDEMAQLHRVCRVPLMLDEAIVGFESLERAAGCADLVKLKLAKNGSPGRLKQLIVRARQLGLDVVLGNGVQAALGCWLEAQVQQEMGLVRAGEMNGFRKLLGDPLGFLLADCGSAVELPATLPILEIEKALPLQAEQVFRINRPRQAVQAA
jgi:L-alanine-DL-glutamate epimerase-like enolase superfamily enzyme